MRRVNVASLELNHGTDVPDGYRTADLRVGEHLGATHTRVTALELAPGQATFPYHYENGIDEWLIVVTGHPTLRDPNGEHQLEPADVVFLPPGPEGAHQVRNLSDEPARVLMFSDSAAVVATVYPDSDKLAVWTADGRDELVVRRSSAVDYWDGEAGGT